MQFLLTTEKIRTNDLVKFALSDIKPNKQKDGGTQELGVPYSRLSKMWTGKQISLGAPFVVVNRLSKTFLSSTNRSLQRKIIPTNFSYDNQRFYTTGT